MDNTFSIEYSAKYFKTERALNVGLKRIQGTINDFALPLVDIRCAMSKKALIISLAQYPGNPQGP